jgi:hypothetical protein
MARFMRKGVTKVYFVPTIASTTLVPTTAEVTAGTRLDTQLEAINGFSYANNPIHVPDMSTPFVPDIPGEDSVAASKLTFYEDKVTNAIKTAQPKSTVGYIVFFYAGTAGAVPAAGDKCDVWPIIVASVARMYSAANEAAKYEIDYAPTAPPGEEKAIT